MDLASSASNGRVLATRHISTVKMLPPSPLPSHNAVNSSLLCPNTDFQPDFRSYLEVLQASGPVLWACGAVFVLATAFLFILSLRAVHRHRSGSCTHATFVLSVYPIVASVAFIATVLPRARMVSEAVAQQAVMVAMYHMFCLIIADCGGVDQLIGCAKGARLDTRVPPCCCWPCCIIPRPELHSERLKSLRYLVLQMPIVQGVLYVILLTLYAEDVDSFQSRLMYIQPLIACSILLGVWALVMCVRAAESAGGVPRAKFLALQVAMVVLKLQSGLTNVLPTMWPMPCVFSLHPAVGVNLIHNCVMIVEMFLLSIWAYRLYSCPPSKVATKVDRVVVAVIDESILEAKYKSNDGFTSLRNEGL